VNVILAEHIIEIGSQSAMTSLHSSVMEETGRLGVDIFIDNGGVLLLLDLSAIVNLEVKAQHSWILMTGVSKF